MATYFDTTADSDRLHADVRQHSELDDVVSRVEQEILDYFSTINTGLGTYYDPNHPASTGEIAEVNLAGYDPDPAKASDAFKRAFKQTIADVASWILRNYEHEPGLESYDRGDRSWSWAYPTSYQDWPKGWDHRLIRFRDRTNNIAFGI